MRKKHIILLMFLFISATMFLFAGGEKEPAATGETKEITVFNAASTTDLVDEISRLFTDKTGIIVKTNPASSGTLAKQIEEGAFADVYISASKKWMDYVIGLDLTQESASFIRNRIVLIAPEGTSIEPFELGKGVDFGSLFSGRLSMGDPAHVPAGAYGEEALKFYGWYDGIADRIQPATDVRAALSVVELGEAELGIVYATDAMKSEKVVIVSRFPLESHTPIEYYCATLVDGTPEGKQFYDFLLNEKEVKALYEKYGFDPVE